MNKYWRKLHFLATILAGGFIFLASVTGSILALEPWFLSQNAVSGQVDENLTLSSFQNKLNENFIEIFGLEQDPYGNIKVEGIGFDDEGTFYVDASTAQILAAPKALSEIFNFNRDLHRSLFLKTPGRILVGLACLALVFLVISGIALQIKRSGSLRAIFKPIKILEIKRDGHALWSRYFFLPILIIAVSGTILSVLRFAPAAPNQVTTPEKIGAAFDELALKDIKKVSYPVMDDDPWVIELTDKHLYFSKTDLKLIKAEILPASQRIKDTNFMLHTGEGTKAWSTVLLLSSLVMVFLSFTGFQMIGKKLKTKKHRFVPLPDAEILILVGSETGHTWRFADALEEAFLAINRKVSTISLENLPQIQSARTLLILTSTYGDGDAPENARNAVELLASNLSGANAIKYSVLGFGSRQYPAFCAFAEDVQNSISQLENTQELIPFMTVDNQSVVEFLDWVKKLNKQLNSNLLIDTKTLNPVRKKGLEQFKITKKINHAETFLLHVESNEKVTVQSGDLIGVYPPDSDIERYYSVAVRNRNELILVIKKTGVCSSFLTNLAVGQSFEGYIKPNPNFYYPVHPNPVLMIANGTGIAPFLGMENAQNLLFWGGKNKADFEILRDYLPDSKKYLAFSRELEANYVQDLLIKNKEEVIKTLKSEGTIMICGSLTMLAGVLGILEQIILEEQLPDIEFLKKSKQLRIDCY